MIVNQGKAVPYFKSVSLCFVHLLFVLALPTAYAADPVFPDSVDVEGIKLSRNGTGTRKATVFKVRVYSAALYLEKKSQDGDAILKSPELKQMDLWFLRDVGKDSIVEAWQESFQRACEPQCDGFKENLENLKAAMTDLKEGDRQTYQFNAKGVTYYWNGKKILSIGDTAFARTLLATWLGKHPPTAALKEGLLGKSAD
jgi:hypothetical protein